MTLERSTARNPHGSPVSERLLRSISSGYEAAPPLGSDKGVRTTHTLVVADEQVTL